MVRTLIACQFAFAATLAHAIDFTALLPNRRSEFCESVLAGRFTSRATMLEQRCEKVANDDAECKAKCDELTAPLRSERAQTNADAKRREDSIKRSNALYEAKNSGSMKNYPGRQNTTSEQYCESVTQISNEECQSAFNEGATAADAEILQGKRHSEHIKTLLKSPAYRRAISAVAVGVNYYSVESSLRSQVRQREIATQSGFIDKAEMHRLGAVIVDGREKIASAFKEYSANGGKLNTPSAIASAYTACLADRRLSSNFRTLALSGAFYSQPSPNELAEFSTFAECF